MIAERYFFPRRASLEPARALGLEPVAVEFPGGQLSCLAYRPHPEPALTLLHFHGNGEVVLDYVDWTQELFAPLGLNVFLAEYRGYSSSDGQPLLAQVLDDAERCFQALGLAPERVIVFGRSVGSLPAIEVAARHPVAGLVLESGIADPLERLLLRVTPAELGATREELEQAVRERLDHQQKLAAYRGRLLVLHAQGDDLVPPSHGQRNHDWASNAAHRELVLLPGGDHNSIFFANAEAYVAALRDFVAALS